MTTCLAADKGARFRPCLAAGARDADECGDPRVPAASRGPRRAGQRGWCPGCRAQLRATQGGWLRMAWGPPLSSSTCSSPVPSATAPPRWGGLATSSPGSVCTCLGCAEPAVTCACRPPRQSLRRRPRSELAAGPAATGSRRSALSQASSSTRRRAACVTTRMGATTGAPLSPQLAHRPGQSDAAAQTTCRRGSQPILDRAVGASKLAGSE